ncbi:threonylcarbamoyl-AMP synthase [Permianibacter sp. IMCC34836]|uniref:L-threonylcarbamoyladenylate synthase n=1 Tax=Permianibacter fluminis TaxID=2738515 RepID=UPI001554F97B|nr:L-threonylcarbamoyladenylate synthase [Permianibacter fluminis]NQD37093.1 threonylcarbamoyl-AMP synthase [Permianibacter fluminis]
MSRIVQIHPVDPQPRLIQQVVALLKSGGVIVYPTDTGYAFGWALGDKAATDRVRRMRRLDEQHHFTLVCRDLSELATYAKVEDPAYRVLRAHTPGPYTFILRATKDVPRRLVHEKRKTIGLRVPDNKIAQALLKEMAEPIQSTSLVLPDAGELGADPQDIFDAVGNQVDVVIDGGFCGNDMTTVVDLTDGVPVLVRRGAGDSTAFE